MFFIKKFIYDLTFVIIKIYKTGGASAISARNFPLKNQEIIDSKVYKGRLVNFDMSLFAALDQNGV